MYVFTPMQSDTHVDTVQTVSCGLYVMFVRINLTVSIKYVDINSSSSVSDKARR